MDRKGILIIVVSILLIVDGALPDAASTANQGSQASNNSNHKSDKPNEKTTTDPPIVNTTSDVSDSASSPPPPPPPPPPSPPPSPPPPPPLAADNTAPPPPPVNPDKAKVDPKNTPIAPKQGKANPPPPHGIGKSDVTKVKNPNVITVFDVQRNCSGVPCKDEDKLVACIENVENGSKKIVVVVHNEGEKALEVHLTILSSSKHLKKFKLIQNQTEKINVPLPSQNTELVLNAGHGECVLHLNGASSEETRFLHLPSYDKIVTPINGAYLLISSVVIFGGIWGCCMFRKRKRRGGGVDYQELEMAKPETVTRPDVETAEGWDQGWDDDWDENAVMSPGGHPVGRISANGLTSRAPVKDGWENDWDD